MVKLYCLENGKRQQLHEEEGKEVNQQEQEKRQELGKPAHATSAYLQLTSTIY